MYDECESTIDCMIMYKRSMPVMRTGTSFVFYFNTPLLHSAVAFHEYRELVVSL